MNAPLPPPPTQTIETDVTVLGGEKEYVPGNVKTTSGTKTHPLTCCVVEVPLASQKAPGPVTPASGVQYDVCVVAWNVHVTSDTPFTASAGMEGGAR